MPGRLAAQIRAKYPGAYDDLDDAALEARVLEKYPQYRDLAEPEPDTPAPGSDHPHARVGKWATENLPTLAAGAAGLLTGGLGAPAAMGLSALAGAGGGMARNLLTGKGSTGDAAMAGAGQGVVEGVGRGAGKLAKLAARPLYNWALRAPVPLKREFPDLVDTALKEGVTVGSRGAAKVHAKLAASGQKARDLVAQHAGAAPVAVNREVAPQLKETIGRAVTRGKSGLPNESREIAGRLRTMRKQNPRGVAVQDAQEMKSELQGLASNVYKARDKGAVVNDLGAETNEGIARGLRGALEQRIPEIAGVNQRTQSLMGLDRALENAELRPALLGRLFTAGAGIGGAATAGPMGALASAGTMQALQSPGVQSAAAIGLDRAGNLPWEQLIRAALLAQLSGQDPQ